MMRAQVQSIRTEAIFLGDNTADMQQTQQNPEPEAKLLFRAIEHKSANAFEKDLIAAKTLAKFSKLGKEIHLDKKSRSLPPIVLSGFTVQNASGTPPDNTVAANTAGQVVSFVNSSVRFFKSDGTPLAVSQSMSSFFKLNAVPGQNTTYSSNMCDPKVIFDCASKRFIAFGMVCETDFAKSYITFAFSKKEDPTQGWYAYTVKSDAFNQGVWFDHPRIGVNENDVFVSGNMFNNSLNYNSSYIYQFDKVAGLAGAASPAVVVHKQLQDNPFTPTFANHGTCGALKDTMYAFSGRTASFVNPGPFTSFKMYTIVGKASDAITPKVTYASVPTNVSYEPAGYAVQPNSSIALKSGDSRFQEAMIVDNTIHLVFHYDIGQGYNGIHYSRITRNSAGAWVANSKGIGAVGKEYAFPSIASAAVPSIGGTGQSAFIGFVSGGDAEFAGMKAVFIDDANVVSPPLSIKTGTTFADYGTLNQIDNNGIENTRWGDYSGIAKWYSWDNGNAARAFVSGHYTSTTNKWINHVALIGLQAALNSDNLDNTNGFDMVAYPNPVQNKLWYLQLEWRDDETDASFVLVDITGKEIKTLLKSNLRTGMNTLQVNTDNIASGSYFVKVVANQQVITTEKLIIAN